MFGRPNDMSDAAKADRARVRKEGRVGQLERSLTPSQSAAYKRWEAACRRMGVPLNTDSRFEFLSDLKEDVTS